MNSKTKDWLTVYAKIGYVSKGVVYFLVGTLTARFALNLGGEKASNTDVFYYLIGFPGGPFILGVMSLGLLGYSIQRIIQGIKDTENKGTSGKGLIKRASYVFSGVFYTGLAFGCGKIALGSARTSQNDTQQKMIASKLLELPYGDYLIGAIGLIIIGSGLFQIYKGMTGSFMKHVTDLPSDAAATLRRVGKIGFTSRGIVFGIVGFLFIKAAWFHSAQQAGGKTGAFTYLHTWPYGSYVLAAVALGFVAYGIFMFVQAKYSRIAVS